MTLKPVPMPNVFASPSLPITARPVNPPSKKENTASILKSRAFTHLRKNSFGSPMSSTHSEVSTTRNVLESVLINVLSQVFMCIPAVPKWVSTRLDICPWTPMLMLAKLRAANPSAFVHVGPPAAKLVSLSFHMKIAAAMVKRAWMKVPMNSQRRVLGPMQSPNDRAKNIPKINDNRDVRACWSNSVKLGPGSPLLSNMRPRASAIWSKFLRFHGVGNRTRGWLTVTELP